MQRPWVRTVGTMQGTAAVGIERSGKFRETQGPCLCQGLGIHLECAQKPCAGFQQGEHRCTSRQVQVSRGDEGDCAGSSFWSLAHGILLAWKSLSPVLLTR